MQFTTLALALTASAAAAAAVLETRNAYGVGITIFDGSNCGGDEIGVLNHDQSSSNAAWHPETASEDALSFYVKDDGADKSGCVTVYSDASCQSNALTVPQDGAAKGSCYNIAADYSPQCIVLGSGGGVPGNCGTVRVG